MKILNSYNEINKEEWQQLIDSSPVSSFFQTSDCYQFYSSLSFLKPFVFAVSENDKLTGVMCGYVISDGNPIKKFFSKRAIVPGGLLIHPEISTKAMNELLRAAEVELKQKAIYIEIRNYNDYTPYRELITNNGFIYLQHLNFHVTTPDVETVTKNLSTTKRRDVKLSRNEGVEWYVTRDKGEISEYYSILSNLYKTRIKTPLFPLDFFEKLSETEAGKIFVVKYDGKIIGGSVCVSLPGKTLYEWFVCGLDGQSKNVFPSTIATWAAIEYAAGNGYGCFDMMGAGKPEESYGVREFKSKFGGELVEHGRFLYICKPLFYNLGKYIVKKLKSKK